MLPARFLSFTGCEARSYAYLFPYHIFIHLECPIVIPAKSQIDLSKNNTGIQLRETNSSATNVNTFEKINLRDLPDILCQTFVHTSCPGTGQTEGTMQYIHLTHCYLRLIQQPLHFTPSSIIFSINDSQRLCQYRVVLWIIIQPVSPY